MIKFLQFYYWIISDPNESPSDISADAFSKIISSSAPTHPQTHRHTGSGAGKYNLSGAGNENNGVWSRRQNSGLKKLSENKQIRVRLCGLRYR